MLQWVSHKGQLDYGFNCVPYAFPMVLVHKKTYMTDCEFGQGQMLDSIFQHHGVCIDVPYIGISVHVLETSAK